MEEVNKAKGPTTGLIDALGEALNHLGYEDIEEGNLYDALMGVGTGNDTLRSLLCTMVEDLVSYAECLDSANLARERRSTLLDPKEDLPSFIEKLTSVLQNEGYEIVVAVAKLKEEGALKNFINRIALLESLASEVAALKLLTARKAINSKPATPAQLIEEALEPKKKKKGDEVEPHKEEAKEKEVDFTSERQPKPPREYVKEIYLSFHQNTAENLTQYKTSSDVLRGIETSIAESLSTCPDDYLTPLFQTLSPTQLKEFEKKHEEFKNDYDARRKMVVKRFFSTLNSLLRSRHLDGIKQKVLGGYANRHIRVYLNAHPGVFTYYDVLTLKKDTLIAQFEVPRHRRTEDQVGVKTVIVKGLERPKKFLTVSKTKKKNLKKRAKKKWAVSEGDENTSLPAHADLAEEGDGDGEDEEPLNDEEMVERFNGNKAEGNREEEKEERKKKREEDTKKQLAEIQKMKQENKGQRLSKKEQQLLKQQEKQDKRAQRQKRKVEKVKEANEKQRKDEGEEGEDAPEGEAVEGEKEED